MSPANYTLGEKLKLSNEKDFVHACVRIIQTLKEQLEPHGR